MQVEKKLQKRTRWLFDRKAQQRQISPGDQVMFLLPVMGSPFQARFAGPFTIKQRVSKEGYLISMPKG